METLTLHTENKQWWITALCVGYMSKLYKSMKTIIYIICYNMHSTKITHTDKSPDSNPLKNLEYIWKISYKDTSIIHEKVGAVWPSICSAIEKRFTYLLTYLLTYLWKYIWINKFTMLNLCSWKNNSEHITCKNS